MDDAPKSPVGPYKLGSELESIEQEEMEDAPNLSEKVFDFERYNIQKLDKTALRERLLNETFSTEQAQDLALQDKTKAMIIIQGVINEVEKRLDDLKVVKNAIDYEGKKILSTFDRNMLDFEIFELRKDIGKLEKFIEKGEGKIKSWTEILAGYTTKLEEYAVKIEAEQTNNWEGELVRLEEEYEKLETNYNILEQKINNMNKAENQTLELKRKNLETKEKKLKNDTKLKKIRKEQKTIDELYDRLSKLIVVQAFIYKDTFERENIVNEIKHNKDMIKYINKLLKKKDTGWTEPELLRRLKIHKAIVKNYSTAKKAKKILKSLKPKPSKKKRLMRDLRKNQKLDLKENQMEEREKRRLKSRDVFLKSLGLSETKKKMDRLTTKIDKLILTPPPPKRKLQLRF